MFDVAGIQEKIEEEEKRRYSLTRTCCIFITM
jgi:hypothetical protein